MSICHRYGRFLVQNGFPFCLSQNLLRIDHLFCEAHFSLYPKLIVNIQFFTPISPLYSCSVSNPIALSSFPTFLFLIQKNLKGFKICSELVEATINMNQPDSLSDGYVPMETMLSHCQWWLPILSSNSVPLTFTLQQIHNSLAKVRRQEKFKWQTDGITQSQRPFIRSQVLRPSKVPLSQFPSQSTMPQNIRENR